MHLHWLGEMYYLKCDHGFIHNHVTFIHSLEWMRTEKNEELSLLHRGRSWGVQRIEPPSVCHQHTVCHEVCLLLPSSIRFIPGQANRVQAIPNISHAVKASKEIEHHTRFTGHGFCAETTREARSVKLTFTFRRSLLEDDSRHYSGGIRQITS